MTDVADEEPSPPLEVDMRTFSELARAQPLEHSLVMGGKENFRVNGFDGEHQPAGRRSNAPVAELQLERAALELDAPLETHPISSIGFTRTTC